MSPRTLLILLCATGCATTPDYSGPMAVRNQHPAQLTVLHMDASDTETLAAGAATVHWNTAHTNMFLAGDDPQSTFEMDGELMRTAVGSRFGLGHGWELGFELPLIHTTGGFLDEFVELWHEVSGLPEQGRGGIRQNRYRVAATHLGNDAFTVDESTLELADVPIVVSFSPVEPSPTQPYGLALRAGVELPTGDADAGFGNGGVDVALGLVGEWRCDPAAFTAHLQHTFASTPDRYRATGLEFGDVTSAALGVEIALADDAWLLLQTEWETSTLRQLGLDRTDKDQLLLWTGLRIRIAERTRLELALAEDLSAYIAPDFSLWLGIATDIGILR